jgi:HSP20 family molecular chaperone IbpA
MSSFLERLKKKDVIPSTPDDAKKDLLAAQNKPVPTADAGIAAEQLKVDIFQSASAIIIYAQIAGATVNDYSVTIEGDGDIITIKGARGESSIVRSFFRQKLMRKKHRRRCVKEFSCCSCR